MRRQSTLIYLIFGAIILIFAVNFGPGSAGCSRGLKAHASWAARVNGEVIKPQDFGAQLALRMDSLRRMAESQNQEFDAALMERMGIRRRVIDQMVERRLVAQDAAKHGIVVSDEDLLRYLGRTYGVHKVSYKTYADWVTRSFGTSVAQFEAAARQEAAGEMMVRAMQDGVSVGDAELKTLYQREHDRVRGSYVQFAVADDLREVAEPTEQAIAQALEGDQGALDAQYNRDIASYRTPARLHLRQIVRRLDQDAPEAAVRDAHDLLLQVKTRIEAGEDFAKLATEHSQDEASRARGGDMGMLDQGTLARSIEQVAFALEPGKVAQAPIRTPEGLHLIQLVEAHSAGLTPLSEVRREVAAHMLKRRAAEAKTRARAEALLAQLTAGRAIETLTRSEDAEATQLQPAVASALKVGQKPVLRDFGWTRRVDEAIARIGPAPELQRALFAQPEDQTLVRQVFQGGDAFYVTVLKEREKPQMDRFATDSEGLRQEALAQKQDRVLTDWVAYLRAQGNVELNPQMLSSPLIAEPEEGQI